MKLINSGSGYRLFCKEAEKKTYVDKSLMIDSLFQYTRNYSQYVCVTRPRRFGKTIAANMIAAFFEVDPTGESGKFFESLKIGEKMPQHNQSDGDCGQAGKKEGSCWEYQGKCNVIRMNLINLLTNRIKCYEEFVEALEMSIRKDLKLLYPEVTATENMSIPDMLQETGDQFIIVIDEWDAVFDRRFMKESDKEDYILFLEALLKDQDYVQFVYMTGVKPIAKYSSGSSLNMFHEFSILTDRMFYPYFGLTADEIEDTLWKTGCMVPSMEDLTFWYDGYIRVSDGVHTFNPASVSKALAEGMCQNNWTGTGPMNEIQELIRLDIDGLRNDVVRLVGGEELEADIRGYASEKAELDTKNEILSAMLIYGFLTYYDQKIKIPNHELMLKFQEALVSKELGLKQTLEESRALVAATLAQNETEIAERMEILHDEKIPFFVYNDENSLSCTVVIGYLAALNNYTITREEKAGKGFVDFLFIPYKKSDVPIILELKYNHSAENAVSSIKERDYLERLRNYPRILLVGINYSERTKKHTCKTEMIKQER